jgi:hypothetical protein
LRAQTAERQEALTARLNSMVEDLTGKPYVLQLIGSLVSSSDAYVAFADLVLLRGAWFSNLAVGAAEAGRTRRRCWDGRGVRS